MCVVGMAYNQLNCPDFKKTTSQGCKSLNKTSNHSTWNSSALPSDGRLVPRKEYFSSFQVPAMERVAGSFFSLHGHGQLVCSLFSSPVCLQVYGLLFPAMSMLLVSCHHPIYLATLPRFCPYCWIVSVFLWFWLLACRIALIKNLMKGNANEHFACILSQSSSFPSLLPREGENEKLVFCCFLVWERTVEIFTGLGGAL